MAIQITGDAAADKLLEESPLALRGDDAGPAQLLAMEWTYTHHAGRGIDIDLGPESPGWNEALADSITSMPPRSSWSKRLSTYWIDHTLTGLRAGVIDGKALTSGNSTEIVLRGDVVLARSLYDLFDEEPMDPNLFEGLLLAWRAEVVEHRRNFRIEKAYRRNGFD